MGKTGNTEQDERGLLPYPVIIAATKGDPEAMQIVIHHYDSYIATLSMRKLRDERGNTYLFASVAPHRNKAICKACFFGNVLLYAKAVRVVIC